MREGTSPDVVSAFGRSSVSRRTLTGKACVEYGTREPSKCSVRLQIAAGEASAEYKLPEVRLDNLAWRIGSG
jgi:hypothetical protein